MNCKIKYFFLMISIILPVIITDNISAVKPENNRSSENKTANKTPITFSLNFYHINNKEYIQFMNNIFKTNYILNKKTWEKISVYTGTKLKQSSHKSVLEEIFYYMGYTVQEDTKGMLLNNSTNGLNNYKILESNSTCEIIKTDIVSQGPVINIKSTIESMNENEWFSLNVTNIRLETLVAVMSRFFKINILFNPKYKDTISIYMRNKIPVKDGLAVFQALLNYKGYRLRAGRYYYMVEPVQNKQLSKQITKCYTLKHLQGKLVGTLVHSGNNSLALLLDSYNMTSLKQLNDENISLNDSFEQFKITAITREYVLFSNEKKKTKLSLSYKCEK